MIEAVLRSLESQRNTCLCADDTQQWPSGALGAVLKAGVLCRSDCANSITCRECPDNCTVEVHYAGGTDGQEVSAFIECPEREDIPRVYVALDRLLTYTPSPNALASCLANALASRPQELLSGRLWIVGSVETSGVKTDVFLARGLGWPDGEHVLREARSRKRNASAVILVPGLRGEAQTSDDSIEILPLDKVLSLEGNTLSVNVPEIRGAAERAQVEKVPLLSVRTAVIASDDGTFRYSPDFRSAAFNHLSYSFTPMQAKVIEYLWHAHHNATPEVSQELILEDAVYTTQTRLRDVFKNHPAWNVLVVSGRTKGTFRLNI